MEGKEEWGMTKKQKELLLDISKGLISFYNGIEDDQDFSWLLKNKFIDYINYGHFTSTIYLTEEGYRVLLEEYRFKKYVKASENEA